MEIIDILMNTVSAIKPIAKKVLPDKGIYAISNLYRNIRLKSLNFIHKKRFNQSVYQDGINLIAGIKADSGLGQSARLLAREIENTDKPFRIHNLCISNQISATDNSFDNCLNDSIKYNINILHINPNEFPDAFLKLRTRTFDYRYNIAFWLWETEDFPNEWKSCFQLVDEIWTPSKFVSNSIEKKTDKPVITIPYTVSAEKDAEYNRKYFSLPEDKFLFLLMFDSNSISDRKNPVATIHAFKQAFGNNQDVKLIIKINNPSDNDIKTINSIIGNQDNYCIYTKTMTKKEVNSFISCVDVMVSLHRSEGYGLTMAEAMLLGTPCIATNWSANTEFMNEKNSCLVDYNFEYLTKTVGPYKKGTKWASASTEDAAYYMNKLYTDHEFYQKIRENALKDAKELFDVKNSAELINKRIEEIYRKRKI